jgi:hypothetical protein
MMNFKPPTVGATLPPTKTVVSNDVKEERVLCPHCQRTASNGIKCKGICVAESDY